MMRRNVLGLFSLAFICLLMPHCSWAQVQHTCLSNEQAAEIPRTIRKDLYRGQQAFTVSMLQAIQKATPNENIFFSPYSTYHALLLAYFGARNHTEKELVQVLQLQWAKNKNHVLSGYNLEKMKRHIRSKDMTLKFSAADRIYFDQSVQLTSCMRDIFIDELESLDIQANPDQCRRSINNWIANVTQNEIPEMLNSGDVTSETQMVLANAAYFKGQWVNKFDSKNTVQDIFYTSHEKQSFVPMMKRRGMYNLAVDETLQAHILEMPYVTSEDQYDQSSISMIIILPPTSLPLESVLAKVTPSSLEAVLQDSLPREVDVWLPKFAFEQNLELMPILREMGVKSMFDSDADFTNFSLLTKIMFNDAKHVAKIKVDEEGSTASAATVLFSFRSARPIEPAEFKCNHPFLFFIYDRDANAILFTGIYRDPMTQK